MNATVLDLVPVDPRIAEALAAEKAARKARWEITAQVQTACQHEDIGEAWETGRGTRFVCLRCGLHQHSASYPLAPLERAKRTFDIDMDAAVARTLWTDR